MLKSKFYNLDTDTTLSDNSDLYIPSQKATKTYIDTTIDTVGNKISNCILEIPQNLELTLENDVVTLKSGSTVVLSGSTYTTNTTTQDITFTYIGGALGQKYLLFLYVGSFYRMERVAVELITSGTTDSLVGVQNHLWFDTTNKEIKYFRGSTDTYELVTYPLAVIEKTSSFYKFVKDNNGNDMIFNGAGFIGHHIFVYPNVKGLAPNEFNDDGSLKSISTLTNALSIIEMSTSVNSVTVGTPSSTQRRQYKVVDEVDTTYNGLQYVRPLNIAYYTTNLLIRTETPLIYFTYNGTTVTQFDICQPVCLATTEMLDKKQDTLISGTNIKTINNTSILGSGNIDIQGGGSSYTPGSGIDITNDVISVDNTVALKSEIPTVNNPTITITQGGVTKGSFTLNQATGDTIALDAGGGSSTWSYDSTTKTLTIS